MKKYLVLLLILVGLTALVWTQSNQNNFPGTGSVGPIPIGNQLATGVVAVSPHVVIISGAASPATTACASANTYLTGQGGGDIYIDGAVQCAATAFGDTSRHAVKVHGYTSAQLTCSATDASGDCFCGYDGSGFYGPGPAQTNFQSFLIDALSTVTFNHLLTNCRHSGEDQSFAIDNGVIIQQNHGTTHGTALVECSGCFSSSIFRQFTIASGWTSSTGISGVIISGPVPSGVNIPVVSGSVSGGVCTLTVNGTLNSNTLTQGENYPFPHGVWMAPGGSSSATVVVSGATGPNSGTGINITANVSSITAASPSTTFTYPCPSATNGAMTGTITYNVKNSAGGNNNTAADVMDVDHVTVGMSSGSHVHPCRVWALGTSGTWSGPSEVKFTNWGECDSASSGSTNFMAAATDMANVTQTCANYPGCISQISILEQHSECGGQTNCTNIFLRDCKMCNVTDVDGTGQTASSVLLSINGYAPTSGGIIQNLDTNAGHIIQDNIDASCGAAVGGFCDGTTNTGVSYFAGPFYFGPGSQGVNTACYAGGASGTASPAACGNATVGKIAIPASQTTYTVNTASIAANSIFIVLRQTTDNAGLSGSPTCGSTAVLPTISQTSRTAGTSFTISGLSSVAQVTCFEWQFVN